MKDEIAEIWQDPAKEIGELLLDKTVDDISPILAEIPLLSVVVAGIKTGKAWSDFLLAKKVQRFYSAWEALGKKERQEIYEKFKKKPKNFTEKLLLILVQQEDLEKCRLLGELTVRYLQNKIRRADFYDLIETVNRLSLSDLAQIGRLLAKQSMVLPTRAVGERYAMLFVGRGLLTTEKPLFGEQRTDENPHYKLTKLGYALGECVQSIGIGKT